MHTAKGSSRENSVRGREGQLQGSSSGCLAAQIQRHTESTRLPGPLAGVFSPAHTEADSLGAQKVYDRRRFPSTLLPSRDMCRCLVVSHCSSDLVKRRISAEFECVDGHSDFSERKGHNFATLPEKFKKVKGGERTKSQFRKKFQKMN